MIPKVSLMSVSLILSLLSLCSCHTQYTVNENTVTPSTSSITQTSEAVISATISPTPFVNTIHGSLIFSDVQHFYLLDIATGKVDVLLDGGPYFNPMVTTNGYIYYRYGIEHSQIFRVSINGGEAEQISNVDQAGSFAVSRDGCHLAFTSGRTITIYQFNEVGEIIYNTVINRSLYVESLIWSNDGERLAFLEWPDTPESHDVAAYGALYIVDSRGQNLHHLLFDGLRIYTRFPSWSPDDRYIAAPMKDDSGTNIYLIDVQANTANAITRDTGISENPLWSPDGARILFTRDQKLLLVSLDGSSHYTLAERLPEFFQGYQATWSPDGNYIAFVEQSDHIADLYIYSLTGSGINPVETNVEFQNINNLTWVEFRP